MFETIDKYMRSRVDIDDLAASVKYKRDFRKKNPTYFEPDGILVFCGPQGSGKTLSAVRYVLCLLYTSGYIVRGFCSAAFTGRFKL